MRTLAPYKFCDHRKGCNTNRCDGSAPNWVAAWASQGACVRLQRERESTFSLSELKLGHHSFTHNNPTQVNQALHSHLAWLRFKRAYYVIAVLVQTSKLHFQQVVCLTRVLPLVLLQALKEPAHMYHPSLSEHGWDKG